jgi:hypothetical protein
MTDLLISSIWIILAITFSYSLSFSDLDISDDFNDGTKIAAKVAANNNLTDAFPQIKEKKHLDQLTFDRLTTYFSDNSTNTSTTTKLILETKPKFVVYNASKAAITPGNSSGSTTAPPDINKVLLI